MKKLLHMLLTLLISSAATAQTDYKLPDLGDASAAVLSAQEEETLGRDFMISARNRLQFINDPLLLDYLTRLGRKLGRFSDMPLEKYHFYVIDDPNLNAFAVPGGHITVYAGLIQTTRNEGELASVLAHEIAHITQHHLARLIARGKETTLPTVAALIAAILLGGQAGTAAIVATNAALMSDQIQYTRRYEKEADDLGIRTLARAGFDPNAMPTFFERMLQRMQIQDNSAPEFFRSHPLTTSRIAEAKSRAAQFSADSQKSSSVDFQYFRARAMALYGGRGVQSAQSFIDQANLQENTAPARQKALRYGRAVALGNNGKYAAAQVILKDLQRQDPRNPWLLVSLAEITQNSDVLAAERLLKNASSKAPDNMVFKRYLAQILLNNNQSAKAYPILRELVAVAPEQADLHQQLARAAGETGKKAEAHMQMAKYYELINQPQEAMTQLLLAKQQTRGSFYLQTSIEARIESLQEQIQRQHNKLPAKLQGLFHVRQSLPF